jgi:hypothetical protein
MVKFKLIKDAVWDRINNNITDKISDPEFLKKNIIELNVKNWIITLDTYTSRDSVYTRIRTPYVNTSGFHFKIFRKGLMSNVMKLFGMQDIEIGDTDFDNDFIIQSDDTEKVKNMLSDRVLRELISEQPTIFIQVKNDEGWFNEAFPNGVDELYIEVKSVISNIDQLESLYNIFTKILDYLCSISSEYS